jgi:hypothetical protein
MKKIFIFIFVLISVNAFSQGGIQKVNGYGFHYNRHYADTLQGLPRDTFAVPTALKTLAWIAAKNELLYFWSSSLNKWIQAAGGTGGGVYSAGLFLSLSANRFAFDTTAFKNWLRTDSIYVVTPLKVKAGSVMDTLYQNVVSATDSGYVTPVMKGKWDTAYLKQPISGSYASGTITVTLKDGSTWTIPGLPTGGGGSGVSEFRNLTDVNLSATYGALPDSRVAIYDSATQKWKDQAAARFNLTAPVLDSSIVIYDSVNREWVNAPYPTGTGGSGSTPTLLQVLTAGNIGKGRIDLTTGSGFSSTGDVGYLALGNASSGPPEYHIKVVPWGDLYLGASGGSTGGIIVSPDGSLTLNSGVSYHTDSKTANYTATATDYTILTDATAGAITISLPDASSLSGKTYIIKKTDSSSNAVTIDPNGSQTIDGVTTYTLSTQYKYVTVQAYGGSWLIIGNN